MNATYADAIAKIQAGQNTAAMSLLRGMLDTVTEPETRVQVLTAAADLAVNRLNQVAATAAYLLEVHTILDTEGNLPPIHRANVAILTAQVHIKKGEHDEAAESLQQAIFIYRAEGDEANAINGELLLAACRLAQGDTTNALGICRKVRTNPACDGRKATENQKAIPSRLLELNVLQAKVAAAMGKHEDMRRLVRNAIEGLRTRLGESDFRTLAELAKVADVDFSWMLNDAAHAEVHPFPTSAPVIGEVV